LVLNGTWSLNDLRSAINNDRYNRYAGILNFFASVYLRWLNWQPPIEPDKEI